MCLRGLPQVLRLRRPIGRQTLVNLDGIGASVIRTPAQLLEIHSPGFRSFLSTVFHRWLSRPRARTAWDRRKGDLGNTSTVIFEHSINETCER
jgi:hypothetical protein